MSKKLKYFRNWIIFCIFIIILLFFEAIFLLFDIDFYELTVTDMLLINFTKYSLLITLIIAFYYDYIKEKWIDFIKNFKHGTGLAFKYWITGFFIMILSNGVISKFINGVGENEKGVQNLISQQPYFALILTSFFAPFIEEFIFRKSLKDCFNSKLLYMITSGVLFGLVHVLGAADPYEYLLIISYGAIGFFFAKIVSETDNVYFSIIVHAFHNFCLTILSIMVAL